jgi:O-succinylbenzoic acid--CoA ligase
LSDPLSISAAAREAADAPAVRIDDRTFTFDEVARLARDRAPMLEGRSSRMPHALVGTNTLETLATLYALLERRIPALLLHPRLTVSERDALLANAGRLGPVHADAAAVVFTSGTTDEPRAAVLTRSALIASARARESNIGWRDDDCWLACITLAHVGGLSIVTRCLAARRCIALAERFDARGFARSLDAQRITLVSMVPTMLARVLDVDPRWTPPPHFRAVLLGGASASPALFARAAERAVPILATYGLTETCSQATTTRYADRYRAHDNAGEPLPGVEIRIVDGHIEIRGDILMAGYWGEPPLAPGSWFHTGDIGEIDSRGCLRVLARRADLIITGGENVYPAEVERALESLAGIAAAAVFGVTDELWGETVAAALVADGVAPDDATLRSHIDTRLAPHKRPRRICFVPALPHTAGGKLDRRALAALARSLRPL